jgi:hypothetical protein
MHKARFGSVSGFGSVSERQPFISSLQPVLDAFQHQSTILEGASAPTRQERAAQKNAPGPDRAVLPLVGELGQRHRRAQYI